MVTVFACLIALILVFPLIGYILAFIITKNTLKNHRKAVHLSIDLTTFFLLYSVHFFIKTIWNISLLWLLYLLVLIIGFIFSIYYWRVYEEMDVSKVLRGAWRVVFLVFLFVYIVLLLYGLTVNVMEMV
ncbi:Ca2+/Na+ antiporter [Oikeobacillus pervagus]|uniref:Ca2+/Na+ antiporter n=1 Tax=Oikeobacillus pervagus TaxID=1325931 RepID=A0AAJ1T212_9BACI|nr:DUF3397 domain-containing protein [Oikeobacillus pervagus]MDQ0215231.1 Ca2+/Na+ antiporter [Oikeobacillus pervagus]